VANMESDFLKSPRQAKPDWNGDWELRARRVQAGLTIKEAAGKVGRHPRTWRRWESGETKPSRADLGKIYELLPVLIDKKASEKLDGDLKSNRTLQSLHNELPWEAVGLLIGVAVYLRGKTRNEVANETGIGETRLDEIILGDRPSYTELVALCDNLKIRPGSLLACPDEFSQRLSDLERKSWQEANHSDREALITLRSFWGIHAKPKKELSSTSVVEKFQRRMSKAELVSDQLAELIYEK